MAGLRVIHPGAHSTIQDRGRFGFRHLGVPIDGPFDRASHAIANSLVGNDDTATTVEMTLFGGIYQAECPLAVALAGANMCAVVEGADGESRSIRRHEAFTLAAGDRLSVGGCSTDARTYLAVRGGFLTEVILGSRSRSTRLEAGELLPAAPSTTLSNFLIADHRGRTARPIRLLEGPDASSCQLEDWIGRVWQVGPLCDRVGIRLENPEPVRTSVVSDRRSVPVAPGTVQVAGGFPIILGPSCGTMGGYPIAAVVISADMARIGQLREGDKIEFVRVDLAEARQIDAESRNQFRSLCDLLRCRVSDGGGE